MNAVLFAALALAPLFAWAQQWPTKPVRVVVATTAGGTTDTIARLAAQDIAPRLGQPMVVENRAGANGIIATDTCAKAGVEAHTICIVSTNSLSHAPHVMTSIPYDPDRDLRAVVHLYNLIEGLVATPSLPANTVHELQALAAAKKGALNFGTLGPGTGPDIMRQWLAERWKTDIAGIHYKGAQPIIQALVAGEIHFTLISLGNSAAQLRAGKIKALGQGGSTRSKHLPNVPTLEEAGIDFRTGGWWGAVMASQTPDAVVRRLNTEYVRALREPKLAELMDAQFLESMAGPPEAFAAFLKADRARAGEIVRRFNIPKE